MEKKLHREHIYDGKVVKLVKDQVELDNGTKEYREIVHHRGGVCIALKNEEKRYYMVKQYRYAFNDYLWEFPAGKLEENEDIVEAIKREALEEVGATVKKLKYHHYFIPTCGYSTEKIHLFSGEVESITQQHLENGEDLSLHLFSIDEIMEKIVSNEIIDGKTIILAYQIALKNK